MRAVAMMAMVVAVACGACGGGDSTLEGSWTADLNSACFLVCSFGMHDGTYVANVACQTGSNRAGVETEAGGADYSVPGKVTSMPRRTSCPTSDHSGDTASYSVDGDHLVFTTASGIVSMNRIKGGGGGTATGAIDFGCWDMGVFSPHPVQDL